MIGHLVASLERVQESIGYSTHPHLGRKGPRGSHHGRSEFGLFTEGGGEENMTGGTIAFS